MENREIITISSEQLRELTDGYLEINGQEVNIEIVEEKHEGSNRHTEDYSIVIKLIDTDKYFKGYYSTSNKETMGWYECNPEEEHVLEQVFPKIITKTIYQ